MSRAVKFYSLAVLLMLAMLPARLFAHGNNPPYIAIWAGLASAEAAQCQRQLGESGKRCVESVLRNEMRCAETPTAAECSPAAKLAARAAATMHADVAVAAICSTDDVKELLFRDLSEAQTDLKLACEGEADALLALMSATEAPALQPCHKRTAVIARLLVRQALRGKRTVLDRIITHPQLASSRRLALVNDCRRRLSKTRTRLADQLRSSCPQFETAIGRRAEAWLVDLELRVDCVVYASYIQSAFTCPFLTIPATK